MFLTTPQHPRHLHRGGLPLRHHVRGADRAPGEAVVCRGGGGPAAPAAEGSGQKGEVSQDRKNTKSAK